MTRYDYETHKKVFHAWIDGLEVEYRTITGDKWSPSDAPSWFYAYEYRVKPFQPKQGDTILVRSTDQWIPKTFVRMYNGKYQCISSGSNGWYVEGISGDLLSTGLWAQAKPYVEEEEECNG